MEDIITKKLSLLKVGYVWKPMRLQDFKMVCEYNSTLFKIRFLLKLCCEKIMEEDKLEKTFSVFHVSNVLLY